MKKPEETWRNVAGFFGYQVSSAGRVRSLDRTLCDGRKWRGRMMRQRVDKKGYANICLSVENQKYDRRVGVLVALAFVGPKPKGMELAHDDGVRLNNCVTNLKWCTHLDNEADKVRHGTLPTGKRNGKYTKPHCTPVGEDHGQHKLTVRQVRFVRRATNRSSSWMANKFSVSKTAIKLIRNRKNWAHLN